MLGDVVTDLVLDLKVTRKLAIPQAVASDLFIY
jgi:hypothetical protein